MSIPSTQADGFFNDSRGKTTIFLFHDKEVKIQATGFILKCASATGLQVSLFDTDAFFGTNVQRITKGINDQQFLEKTEMILPELDFTIKSLASMPLTKSNLLILDGLNSLYSLASTKSDMRKLLIFMKALSYFRRTNNMWTFVTIYRSEWSPSLESRGDRSLTSLGDVVVQAEIIDGHRLVFRPVLDDKRQNKKEGEFAPRYYFDI